MCNNEESSFFRIVDFNKKQFKFRSTSSISFRKNALLEEIKRTSPPSLTPPFPFFGNLAFSLRKWWNPNRSERAIEPPRGVFGIVPRHQSTFSRRLLSLKYVRRGWKRADDIHTRCQRGGGRGTEWRFPESSTVTGWKGWDERGLKERGRKAKAYPAVLHATANSRSDCNVRRFVDFDGARVRRCEATDIFLSRGPSASCIITFSCNIINR